MNQMQLENNHTDTPQFIFPTNARYRCVGCGHCCRQQWVVEVEKECRDALPDDLKAKIEPSQQQYPEAAGILKAGQSEAGCPLLDTDKLCVIHKRLGYDAKPFVCRAFPFRFIETPRGVAVDVSFVCNGVLNNRGDSIEQHRPEIEKLYAGSTRRIKVGERVLLKSKTSVTFDAYRLIEESLLHILSERGHTVEDRLVAGNIFLCSLYTRSNCLSSMYVAA